MKPTAMPTDAVEDAYPLTRLQAGMLFHSEYQPDSAIYHDIFSYQLRAPFDAQALRDALQQLVDSHPILRTSFELASFSQPLQLVHRAVAAPLQIDDLRPLAESEQAAALAAWIEAEKRRPFDWAAPPLLRFHAHRRAADSFQFSVSFHHAILDGWSVASMLTELFQRYLARLGKAPAPAPPPRATFRDYVALERQALESEECRQFWRRALAEASTTTLPRWPAGAERPARRVARYDVPLAPEIGAGLRELARRAQAPIATVLLAAHGRVLALLGGTTDVVTGLLSNGRPEHADGERALGLFLNAVPLRLQLGGGSWLSLVRATFAAEQALLPFRRYPLAEIQRLLGRQPLFESMFTFTNFHVYARLAQFDELQVLGADLFEETNLTLDANFSQDTGSAQVFLSLSYDASAFGPAQLAAIGGYYARALAAMAASPDARYEHCDLLGTGERQQLLHGWNDTRATYPAATLHGLFEAQAARTPEATALVFEGQQLSYAQLDWRANRLARRLIELGVARDDLVGICVERSVELVVGLLAILKAGAAYVPLDPGYPAERLAFMLRDAAPPVLLPQPHLAGRLPAHGAQVLVLAADAPGEPAPVPPPAAALSGENLAYAIYTSGSTGQPKCAMNTHAAIVNRLLWMQAAYQLAADDRVLQKTPFSFDVSVWEFFWPLIAGARLVIARPGGHQDPRYLADTIAEHAITTVHFVPSMLQLFLETPGLARCASLRRVICSGEALPADLRDRCLARLPAELHNLYGPTEAAVDVTAWACARGDARPAVPIGRPIANTQIYLLDTQLQPVPLGVPGELYIGGAGLARGYLRRPQLTAERFVPSPFGPEPGARLYRSGDLARFLPDGAIEFLGRIDHQVKIRGFRIELDEIVAALAMHPAVRESVVLAREDAPGDRRLVAYVVPRATPAADGLVAELRALLAARLPEYMLPSAFVLLPALPLTPSGKADRRALPPPDMAASRSEQPFVAPRTPVEASVAAVWAEVLGLARIGVNDNFFELGGHSLLAVEIIFKLRERFQVDLPLQSLFDARSVANLATLIVQRTAEQADSALLSELLAELEDLPEDAVRQLFADTPELQEPPHE